MDSLLSRLLGGGLLTLERRPILAGVMFGLMSYKPQYGMLVPIFLIATGPMAHDRGGIGHGSNPRRAVVRDFRCANLAGLLLQHRIHAPRRARAGRQRIRKTAERLRGRAPVGLQRRDSLRCAGRGGLDSRDRGHLDLVADSEFRSPCAPRSQPVVLLMTPYMMDYDLVILALPIAWIALEGARSGFLPWEKSLLAFGLAAAAVRALTRRPRADSNRTTRNPAAAGRHRSPRSGNARAVRI